MIIYFITLQDVVEVTGLSQICLYDLIFDFEDNAWVSSFLCVVGYG